MTTYAGAARVIVSNGHGGFLVDAEGSALVYLVLAQLQDGRLLVALLTPAPAAVSVAACVVKASDTFASA